MGDGSETLVDGEMPDEASSVQLIEKLARKSLRQTHKKRKGKDQRKGIILITIIFMNSDIDSKAHIYYFTTYMDPFYS